MSATATPNQLYCCFGLSLRAANLLLVFILEMALLLASEFYLLRYIGRN
jgi:hypothetical protein